jgi:hypothetical protein
MAIVALSAVGLWAYLNWHVSIRMAIREWSLNRPIWQGLNQTVTLHYPDGITLDKFLARFKPLGLVVYVDPIGLEEAGVTTTTVVKIDKTSVSAKVALDSVLKPMGLNYSVRNGLLTITSSDEVSAAAEVAAKKSP